MTTTRLYGGCRGILRRLSQLGQGFALACMLCLGLAQTGWAQSPPPMANPNLQLLTNGVVGSIVRLPDGSVIFGGEFTSVSGTPRNNLAKLQPNGTLDADWNPSPDDQIYALALDGSGNVYVGGPFTSIGGQSRNYIAKLSGNGTGAADPNWNPSADDYIDVLAVDNSGNVYAGGGFSNIGTQPRNYIAKLSGSGTGAADANWNPSPNHEVYALALDGSGNVYAGGIFTQISAGAQFRKSIAKLSGSGIGTADPNWNPNPSGGSSSSSSVYGLAFDSASNSVYVGGDFSSIGGEFRHDFAKLSGSGAGAADVNWNPSPNDVVYAIALDGSGNVYVGGSFASIGGQSRIGIAKLSGGGLGAADPNWDPLANNGAAGFALDSSGNVYVGGAFTSIGGQSHFGLGLVSASGQASSATPDVEAKGNVAAVVVQPGGGAIVGGSFLKANDQPRANLLRLQADGTLDPTWNPTSDNSINAIAVDSSSNVYVSGLFTHIGGQPRNAIAKLSGSGAGDADPIWNPSPNDSVRALAVDSNGDVFVSGDFTRIGVRFRNYLAKLSGNGAGDADTNWNPNPSSGSPGLAVVTALAVGSGNVYVSGSFTFIGGQSRNAIAKLSGSGAGAADVNWNPNPSTGSIGSVFLNALAVDSIGNVFVSGFFTSIGGQPRNYIAKLSGSGTGDADPDWNPSGFVSAFAFDGSGNVYVGGGFVSIGGQSRKGIAKLSGSGTGAVDASWNPSAIGGFVSALAVDSSGDVYAGGNFTSIGGQARSGLARLQGDVIFANGFE